MNAALMELREHLERRAEQCRAHAEKFADSDCPATAAFYWESAANFDRWAQALDEVMAVKS